MSGGRNSVCSGCTQILSKPSLAYYQTLLLVLAYECYTHVAYEPPLVELQHCRLLRTYTDYISIYRFPSRVIGYISGTQSHLQKRCPPTPGNR